MNLLRTSALNGIAVSVKMAALLVINKLLAVYVGPVGYAALGQLQNAIQMLTTFASGATNNGVVKYTAEYHHDPLKQQRLWRTAGTLAICGSLFFGGVIVLFRVELSKFFLADATLSSVFVWFGCTLVLFTLNSLMLAMLNGKKEIVGYVYANIAGSLCSLMVTSVLSVLGGLYGALIALAIYQAVSFFATFIIALKQPWFAASYLFGRVDPGALRNLLKFTAMALTASACMPLAQIFIRNYLGTNYGWVYSGYWEAILRLSAAYLLVVTTTLSVYYLPRLSELTTRFEINQELKKGYMLLLPFTALSGLAIYFLRDVVVELLFSQSFYEMRSLFAWQMVGNSLKVCSWLLSYLMLSKAMYKLFITAEIAFCLLYCVLTIVFCNFYGADGVVIAYAALYAIYWPVIGMLVYKNLKLAD